MWAPLSGHGKFVCLFGLMEERTTKGVKIGNCGKVFSVLNLWAPLRLQYQYYSTNFSLASRDAAGLIWVV